MTELGCAGRRVTRRSGSFGLRLSAAVGQLQLVILSGVMGAALLAMAVPRTLAAWYNAQAEPALHKLQTQGEASPQDLARGLAALQQSLYWNSSARRLGDLSLLELAQAISLPPEDPLRRSLLALSHRHLVESLVANPADGFGWLRLAMERELLGAPGRAIAAALAKSLDVAPNVRPLWLPRATMFLAYWLELSSDELLAMKNHLQIVWSEEETIRMPLMQAAERGGRLPILRWALIGNEHALEELRLLEMKRKPRNPQQ
jgi:hypothetical protein